MANINSCKHCLYVSCLFYYLFKNNIYVQFLFFYMRIHWYMGYGFCNRYFFYTPPRDLDYYLYYLNCILNTTNNVTNNRKKHWWRALIPNSYNKQSMIWFRKYKGWDDDNTISVKHNNKSPLQKKICMYRLINMLEHKKKLNRQNTTQIKNNTE